MKEYILDVNVDIGADKINHPSYFFNDLKDFQKRIRLVYGGSTYHDEVTKKDKLRDFISDMLSCGKVRKISNEKVDEAEQILTNKISQKFKVCPKECDDPHIFALSLVSGCNTVISNDKRMATCRGKIRPEVGHQYCPDLKIICNEKSYKQT